MRALAVVIGQERVGFGVAGIAAQDGLGPSQPVFVAAVGEHPGGDLDPQVVAVGVCHQRSAQSQQLVVVVGVSLEQVEVLPGPLGIAQHGADPAPAIERLGVEAVDFEGPVQKRERFLRFSPRSIDLGSTLERATVTRVDLQCFVQAVGRGFQVAQREIVAPAAGKCGRVGRVACQIDFIFRGCLGVSVYLPERLGQSQPCRVEVAIALQGRAVVVFEGLGVIDFHPAVVFGQPQVRPGVLRGVADPLADDLLGLVQAVGQEIQPRQGLVDGGIWLRLGLVQPLQDRLGLGEPPDPSQGDGVQPLELGLGVSQSARLVQLIGDLAEIAIFECDLREQGVCFGGAGVCQQPASDGLAGLLMPPRSDRLPGLSGPPAGCAGVGDLHGEEQRSAREGHKEKSEHDGPPARASWHDCSLDGQLVGDHGGAPLDPIVLG